MTSKTPRLRLLPAFPLLVVLASGCGAPAPETAAPEETGETADNGNACQTQDTWALGFQADHCEMADGSLPPIDPTFWPDVCTPQAAAGWSPTQTSFDQLSWRSLLFASWPADPANPGQPDTGQPLGATADGAFLPVVWETFKSSQDLFGEGGNQLTAADFASPGPVPAGCSSTGARVLTLNSKFPLETVQAVRREVREGGLLGEGLDSIDQAFRGPLLDQSGKLVYYEIRMNQTEFDAIVAAGAQNKSPAELNCTGGYKQPDCVPFTFPLGSMEVKAAWKQLTADELASGTFFHRRLQIQDPATGACSEADMGLVGLHIAHKTSHSLNTFQGQPGPSWAWATFEQAANVPPVGSDGTGSSWSFFDPECTPAVTAEQCTAAAATKPNPDPQFQCCENLYRYAPGAPPPGSSPDQITRVDTAPDQTVACNQVYSRTDLAIFANYSLVTTQWPKGVEGPFQKVVTPTHVRNTTLESYFTAWQDGQQVNQSSCMNCHFGSNAVDMSYLFLGNVGG